MGESEHWTRRTKGIRERVSDTYWERLVAKAHRQADIVEQVLQKHQGDKLSLRRSLKAVAPEVEWPTFVAWQRNIATRNGERWERLLDGRTPPAPTPVSDEIRLAAAMIRRVNPEATCELARQYLEAQFGESGLISDSSLRRIWSAHGLVQSGGPLGPGQIVGEQVEHFNGGGGLALLGAAEAELHTGPTLARAALKAAEQRVAEQGEVVELYGPQEGRDDRGRFARDYTALWREDVAPGDRDARWGTDESKREHRDLSRLPMVKSKAESLGSKFLAMGATAMLTERRGFAGLEGPSGGWLATLGVHPYMPLTLDKALTQSGMLGVGDALWCAHAAQWHSHADRWAEGGAPWLRWVLYVDGTVDPYWTRNFAFSGKVSRVSRVMPCLTRVSITSGPGVPLVMGCSAGTVSLKTELVPQLRRLEGWVGEGLLGRLTIIDAEMAHAKLLWTLDQELDRGFITVAKGAVLESAQRRDIGPWQPFRDRDEVREMKIVLHGPGVPDEGFAMRGVEMHRPDSRQEHKTLFLCNWDKRQLSTVEVATAYLSRWPNQEQGFRNGRNGGGLNHSHGFGGELVTHVAFDTKVEKAERKLERAKDHLTDVERLRDTVVRKLSLGIAKPKAKDEATLHKAEAQLRQAEKAVVKANNDLVDACKMPREIYLRDTGRDNIMTCLKLNMLLLLEFVLREYFDGLRMEYRNFIEQFVMLPVTVRTSLRRVLYQIHANPRQPQRMEQLRAACEAINARKLHRDERLLRFEVIEPEAGGS